MAHWARALVTKLDGLSSVSRIHLVKGKSPLPYIFLSDYHIHAMACTHACVCTYVDIENIDNKKFKNFKESSELIPFLPFPLAMPFSKSPPRNQNLRGRGGSSMVDCLTSMLRSPKFDVQQGINKGIVVPTGGLRQGD